MTVHYRFLVGEIRHGGRQALTFMLCVALSIATLSALNSFKRDVHRTLAGEARILQGGDIIIRSSRPVSAGLREAVDQLERQGRAQILETYRFYSVIRAPARERSLFVNIQAVPPGYPFYGRVELASGRSLDHVLQPGRVVVAPEVLDRLGVSRGATVVVGEAELEIVDEISYESARPVSLFTLGPRIFVDAADLPRLELLTEGSRARYEILLKVQERASPPALAAELAASAEEEQERVSTAETAPSRIKRFFDNLLFFLSFISIFTLLLSGIGMQGALAAMLRQKRRSMAVIKAVGASSPFILGHYLAVVLLLGVVGCGFGLAAGLLVKQYLPVLFRGLLPEEVVYTFSLLDLLEGVLVGFGVVLLFTFLPLYRVSGIKPAAIFRSELSVRGGRKVTVAASAGGATLFSLLVISQIEEVGTSLWFMLGLLVLIGLASLAAWLFVRLLPKLKLSPLWLGQAVKSLKRPGNATAAILVTLTSAFTLLLAIYLLKLNMFATYINSYPEGAPNLFCIDIQPDQQERFREIAGTAEPLFPVVRARLVSINDEPIDRVREARRKSDNLGRNFNLTYRNDLLEDEMLSKGRVMFEAGRAPGGYVEVSVLDTIAEIGDIRLGDRLEFNIQGVPLSAAVTSIRTRTQSKLYPFFYFVFQKEVLQEAPQTFFAALHRPRSELPELITEIVREMPNVSTINVADMAVQFGRLFQRLSAIITFFSSFSIVAGLLIMVSAIFATRPDRIREVTYFKVLGAKTSFVVLVSAVENVLLGLFSSSLAVGFASCATWLICRYVFEIVYRPYWPNILAMLAAAAVIVCLVGMVGSLEIIRQKPAIFLREQGDI